MTIRFLSLAALMAPVAISAQDFFGPTKIYGLDIFGFPGSPYCSICGVDNFSITKPEAEIAAPSYTGVSTLTCETLRQAGEEWLVIPAFACASLDRMEIIKTCGCLPTPTPSDADVADQTFPSATTVYTPGELPSDAPSYVPSDMPSNTPSTEPSSFNRLRKKQ